MAPSIARLRGALGDETTMLSSAISLGRLALRERHAVDRVRTFGRYAWLNAAQRGPWGAASPTPECWTVAPASTSARTRARWEAEPMPATSRSRGRTLPSVALLSTRGGAQTREGQLGSTAARASEEATARTRSEWPWRSAGSGYTGTSRSRGLADPTTPEAVPSRSLPGRARLRIRMKRRAAGVEAKRLSTRRASGSTTRPRSARVSAETRDLLERRGAPRRPPSRGREMQVLRAKGGACLQHAVQEMPHAHCQAWAGDLVTQALHQTPTAGWA